MTGAGAWFAHAFAGQERPVAQHCESHFRMELEAIGLAAIAEGLCLEILAPGEQGRPARQIETFPVPLIDVIGEPAVANAMPLFGRLDRVIAHFDPPVRMRTDAVTEMARQHLRAETNAEERRVFLKRDPDPVYFTAQPGVFVVDAHGTAENDRAGVAPKCCRQWIAEAGTPAIELKSLPAQQPPEPPRSRMFLMQDDENPPARSDPFRHRSQDEKYQTGLQG
jgi:hypothetical protein